LPAKAQPQIYRRFFDKFPHYTAVCQNGLGLLA